MDVKASANAMVQAVRGFFERQIASRDAKIADLEKRLAATIEANNAIVANANSRERRLSRHAEHLGRLEDRVRALETSGPPR